MRRLAGLNRHSFPLMRLLSHPVSVANAQAHPLFKAALRYYLTSLQDTPGTSGLFNRFGVIYATSRVTSTRLAGHRSRAWGARVIRLRRNFYNRLAYGVKMIYFTHTQMDHWMYMHTTNDSLASYNYG